MPGGQRRISVLGLDELDGVAAEAVVVGGRDSEDTGDAGVGDVLEGVAECGAAGAAALQALGEHVDRVISETAEDARRAVLRILLCEGRRIVRERALLRIVVADGVGDRGLLRHEQHAVRGVAGLGEEDRICRTFRIVQLVRQREFAIGLRDDRRRRQRRPHEDRLRVGAFDPRQLRRGIGGGRRDRFGVDDLDADGRVQLLDPGQTGLAVVVVAVRR